MLFRVACLSPEACHRRKLALKEAFTALMTADAARVAAAIDALTGRLQAESAQRPLSPKETLVLRLNQQYPQVRPHVY